MGCEQTPPCCSRKLQLPQEEALNPYKCQSRFSQVMCGAEGSSDMSVTPDVSVPRSFTPTHPRGNLSSSKQLQLRSLLCVTFYTSQPLLCRPLPGLQTRLLPKLQNARTLLHCSQLTHSVFDCFTLCFNSLQNINSSSQLNVFQTIYVCGADRATQANGNYIVPGVLALSTTILVFSTYFL